jgi:hypothetical protein
MNVNILAALLVVVTIEVQAQSDIYLCESQTGVREYRNTPSDGVCKRVQLPQLVIVAPGPDSAHGQPATAMPPPELPRPDQAHRSGPRQALEIQLRTAEQRLTTLRKEFNEGEPERRGDERNYAKYQQRVATMQEEITRAQQYIDTLKQELSR